MTDQGEKRILVNPSSHRVRRATQGGGGADRATLRWCSTHLEAVWECADGSVQCPYDLITESNNDHAVVNGPWEFVRR